MSSVASLSSQQRGSLRCVGRSIRLSLSINRYERRVPAPSTRPTHTQTGTDDGLKEKKTKEKKSSSSASSHKEPADSAIKSTERQRRENPSYILTYREITAATTSAAVPLHLRTQRTKGQGGTTGVVFFFCAFTASRHATPHHPRKECLSTLKPGCRTCADQERQNRPARPRTHRCTATRATCGPTASC